MTTENLEQCIERYHKDLLDTPVNNLYETVELATKWHTQMPPAHRKIFDEQIIPKYLEDDAYKTYAIILCGNAKIQNTASRLHQFLQAETQQESHNLPHLITALGSLAYKPAYETIESFIAPKYSSLAIESLARIDFTKSVEHLNNAFNKKYETWAKASKEQLTQRLANIFTNLFYDVGPQKALDYLGENANSLRLKPYFVKDAFTAAFEGYKQDGRRKIFPKRAYYYTKQVTRILTGKQKKN